jgi:hypothetical protein
MAYTECYKWVILLRHNYGQGGPHSHMYNGCRHGQVERRLLMTRGAGLISLMLKKRLKGPADIIQCFGYTGQPPEAGQLG